MQFATSSLEKENYGGRRTLPYVFTEQGIAMLSGLLRNHIAIQVSISIMNAFVEMRRFIGTSGQIFDAYSLIIDVIKKAKQKILIIDNYIDDSILKMLSKKNKDVEVVILTTQNMQYKKIGYSKI